MSDVAAIQELVQRAKSLKERNFESYCRSG